MATDLTVHAWDLARAVDAPDEFPNDLLAHVLEHAKQSADNWFCRRFATLPRFWGLCCPRAL